MSEPQESAVPSTAPVVSAAPVQTAKGLLTALNKEFPVIRGCQPLAIGIDKQLMTNKPDINKKALRSALGMHTRSVAYLKALQIATQRFNLDGSPADEVSEAQRTLAAQTLRDHFKVLADKRKAELSAKAAQAAAAAAEAERAAKLNQLAEKFSRK